MYNAGEEGHMSRSYLFPGRDTKSLTPFELQLEREYDRIDTPSNRITPDIFFRSPEYAQLLNTKYGGLETMIPPGSQIIKQTPLRIEYRDAEGYTHVLNRNGADAASGQIAQQSNRPPILPNTQQQDFIRQLQARLQQALGPTGLAQLDPAAQAAFEAQNTAEKAQLQNQADIERGKLIAGLYGNRVNESSIANQAGANFAEGLGRLQQQQAADYQGRVLQARQFLTNALLQQNQDIGNLYANLSGQQNQRDISSAGLGLEGQQLDEQIRQFNKNYGLNQIGLQQQQQQIDQANSPFNKFLKTLTAVGSLAGGAGTAYGAYKGR